MKPPTLVHRARQADEGHYSGNRKPMYDFLLVIDSNLNPISHRYWDTATYWLQIANFSYPVSFSALVRNDPFELMEKLFCSWN